MKISELLKEKKTFSFEVFPPKEDKPIKPLEDTLDGLYKFAPDFISCTYGAGGSNIGRSFEVCEKIMSAGHTVMTHFTCINTTRDNVADLLKKYINIGIENVLLLRGDIPQGHVCSDREFTHASDLIEFVRARFPDLSLGAAAYPQKHVESDDMSEDMKFLKLKQDMGADYFITQFCHDTDSFEKFLDRADKAGIKIPIVVGILPILFRNGTINMTLSNGCSVPPDLSQIMGRYEDDAESFRKAGKEYTIRQIEKYQMMGVNGLHIYALNRYKDIKDIMEGAGIKEVL